MTKKKFLSELEKRLSVLEEYEIQDILNEYKDMIAEKVKHGKTEKEAIEDFGNIDELVKEILSAYKINPEFNQKKDSTSGEKAKEFVDTSEQIIKEGAKKLSKFTKNVIDDVKESNDEITVELVFEIIIKVIILLVGFAILRLPFMLIESLGAAILDVAFSPIDHILIFMWSGLISVFYFVTCIIISIIVFKKYFVPKKVHTYKNTNFKEKQKSEVKEETIKKEERVVNTKKNSDTASTVLLILVKVFVVIVFLVPLFFVNLGLVAALTVLLFLLLKGLNVLGFLIFIIGFMVITGYISALITNLLFDRKKVYFFPLVIGMLLLLVGGVLIVDRVTEINYYDSLPNTIFEKKNIEYNEIVTGDTVIHNDHGDKQVIVMNELNDGEVKIEVTYYNDLVEVNKRAYSYGDNNFVDISVSYKGSNKKALFDLVLDDLKNDRVYNYTNLFESDIKIYANENTIDLIK